MTGELQKQLQTESNPQKTKEILEAAAAEFPCLKCGSGDECATYAWFIKWFGNSP